MESPLSFSENRQPHLFFGGGAGGGGGLTAGPFPDLLGGGFCSFAMGCSLGQAAPQRTKRIARIQRFTDHVFYHPFHLSQSSRQCAADTGYTNHAAHAGFQGNDSGAGSERPRFPPGASERRNRLSPLGRGGSRQGGAPRFHQRDGRFSSVVATAPESVEIHPTLIPSRCACAPYRGFGATEEGGSNGSLHETQPPYPPLTGGQEKAKPPLPGGGASPSGGRHRLFIPPVKGLLKKSRESILGCVHAFEFHSPLEGESTRQGRSPQASWWGDTPQKSSPHRIGLRTNRSASSTPPQGGSEIQHAPFVGFFNNPLQTVLTLRSSSARNPAYSERTSKAQHGETTRETWRLDSVKRMRG